MSAPALHIARASVTYKRGGGIFGAGQRRVHALADVTVEVAQGECVGIVGESGSGKSTLAAVAMGLRKPDSGHVIAFGRPLEADVSRRTRQDMRDLQIVFQDPQGSLNPTMPVWRIVSEGLSAHGIGSTREQKHVATDLLGEVGLDPSYATRRPHELSGGQRQRVAIARALALKPKILVLDEPTSALDVSVQAQVLNLLLKLQDARGLSYLMISHDLDVIRHMCHRVYVMRDGRVVESGATDAILDNPQNDYTRALIAAIPKLDFRS